MVDTIQLGQSGVRIPPMGLGVMTWGDARGLGRLHPSKSAYGGTETREVEQEAFEQAMQAGVNFFDSAAMYGGGASEGPNLKHRE